MFIEEKNIVAMDNEEEMNVSFDIFICIIAPIIITPEIALVILIKGVCKELETLQIIEYPK